MPVQRAGRADASLRSALFHKAVRHITENSVNAFFFSLGQTWKAGYEARKTLGRQPHYFTSIWMRLFVFQFLKNSSADKALADALSRSQAVIEFGMDGTIPTANENFLKALGYSLGVS
jgi:uncharacterized protein YktB (UPF0637 family)